MVLQSFNIGAFFRSTTLGIDSTEQNVPNSFKFEVPTAVLLSIQDHGAFILKAPRFFQCQEPLIQ
jgi:hypothetical protein